MSVAVVACAVGPRERGVAVGRALAERIARSLAFHRDDRTGVLRVSRHRLQASDREEAHRRATVSGRSGGYVCVEIDLGGVLG